MLRLREVRHDFFWDVALRPELRHLATKPDDFRLLRFHLPTAGIGMLRIGLELLQPRRNVFS
jgi:hypothetical protein